EYNCRFGAPETQPILLRLESALVALCLSALKGELDQGTAAWSSAAAVGVVLAAGGYPDEYRKGDVISGLPDIEVAGEEVFHAGTDSRDGNTVTNGGRVLCATALGKSVAEAQQRAYQLAQKISWSGMFYRKDIGYRAIARE